MRLVSVAMALALFAVHIFAADLFEDGKLRPMKSGDLIQATDTIGGYPIYQDDGRWKFVNGKESSSTGGQGPIKMGSVLFDYAPNNYLLARQSLYASVDAGGSNNSWGGSPCSVDHLVIRNKGRGRQDNCLTIDPKIVTMGTTPTVFLTIVLTNAGSNGRYYQLSLYVNADVLGVRGTGLGDWTKEELEVKPYKKEAMDRLTAWAEQLQDASIKAFDFSKPQDVYAKMPSLMTLLPVPEDIAGQKRTISFLSAVEHLRHQPAFSSIAYSRYEDYKGTWSFVTGKASQEIADATAVAACEVSRKANRPDAPACEIYKIKDGARITYSSGLDVPKTTEIASKNFADQKCSNEAQLRSPSSSVAASVVFENNSGQPAKIYWITFGGERKLYKEIASTQSFLQPTYVSHIWVIADSAGKCLQIFAPRTSTEKVAIN
jgi:VHL beta domain